MKNTSITIPQHRWHQLCKHLLRNDGLEHLAFLLVGVHRRRNGLELLAAELVIIEDTRLVAGAAMSHLEASEDALVDTVNRAIKLELGLVEIHNHPFTTGPCRFSPSDRSGFREVVPYMLSSLKVPLYGAIVLGDQTNADGIFWDSTPSHQGIIDRVNIVGPRPVTFRTSSATSKPEKPLVLNGNALAMFDRQVRAFGKEGQIRLASLSVAIVGLGGIGGIAAEQLSRMGIAKFVLIDHDTVDKSNQNRLPGLSPKDAEDERLKVDLAEQQIKTANPDAIVTRLPTKVFNAEAIKALAEADLIICGTDDSASRFAVNEIALAYLRPYLDIATGINTDHGKMEGVGGRYTFTFPGTGCLLCAAAIDPREATTEFSPSAARQAQERDGYIQGSKEPAASVMPLNGLVTSQAIFEILVWATCVRPPIQQRFFNALEGTVDRVTFGPNAKCASCLENLGRGDLVDLPQKYSRWSCLPTVPRRRNAQTSLFRRLLIRLGICS